MKIFIIKTGIFIFLLLMIGSSCERNKKEGLYEEIEFLKFSDFGCGNDYSWYLNTQYGDGNFVITSIKDFEKYVTIDCNPQIDFSNYTLLIGVKQFNSGASLYEEKVEENNSELVYTIIFLKDISTVVVGINYHVLIKKPSKDKNIRIVEIVKETE